MRRLATIKTLTGFDLTFQPSLDRVRIFMLAQLGFVGRHEVIHFLGPPGTGKSHRESRSASKLSKPARASTSAGPVS
nr:ATP-binding protein [Rhizobium altiplani]